MSISKPEDFVTCKACNHSKSVHVAMGMGNAPPFCRLRGAIVLVLHYNNSNWF